MGRFPFAVPGNRLGADFDRLFSGLLGDWPGVLPVRQSAGSAFPALNVWEESEALGVEAELPGFAIEDLDIQVKGDELLIAGERKAQAAENLTYHRRERGTGAFRRVLTLPVEIDADKVEATLRDGILSLRLPKSAAAKPRKIAVHSA